MSEEPVNLNPKDQTVNPEIINTVPGVNPAPTEQKPQEGIDSVPGAAPSAPTSAAEEKPSGEMKYHGGYTGYRLSPDGTSPNVPVLNNPGKLGVMDALAQDILGKSDQPKD